MVIVFAIYDFVDAKLPLQPWLTIRMLAENLACRGFVVHVVTDTETPALIDNITIHSVTSLRESNGEELRKLMLSLRPDALIFLPTPLNLATSFWLDDIDCRRIGFISYPFYTPFELLTAARYIGWADSKQYLRHLVIPKFLWKRVMRRRFHDLIAQSSTTASRLNSWMGLKSKCKMIPPGIDRAKWPFLPKNLKKEVTGVRLLYLGSAIAIRGFYVALDALALIQDDNVKLRVMARNAGNELVNKIASAAECRGLANRIEIQGGWIDHDQLIEEIALADLVLQPFILVPSELPVTAMEVIACGTPVLGSEIDGLPSTIGTAGTVVKQGSASDLADAIMKFSKSEKLRNAWNAGCITQRELMLDWGAITNQWEAVLRGRSS